jgi:xanthine dehydrogenase YagR molybdenum-binding subunit
MSDMPGSKRAVGQPIDRADGREKVLGRAMFAADHQIPDVAYIVVVQSEISHGVVDESGLDAAIQRATQAPGMLYVLSFLNCPTMKGTAGKTNKQSSSRVPAAS